MGRSGKGGSVVRRMGLDTTLTRTIMIFLVLTVTYSSLMLGFHVAKITEVTSESYNKAFNRNVVTTELLMGLMKTKSYKEGEKIYEAVNYLKAHGVKVYKGLVKSAKVPGKYACNYFNELLAVDPNQNLSSDKISTVNFLRSLICSKGISIHFVLVPHDFNWSVLPLLFGRYPEEEGECVIPLELLAMISQVEDFSLGDEVDLLGDRINPRYSCKAVGVYVTSSPVLEDVVTLMSVPEWSFESEDAFIKYWIVLPENKSFVLSKLPTYEMPTQFPQVTWEIDKFVEAAGRISSVILVTSLIAILGLTLAELWTGTKIRGLLITQGVPTNFLLKVNLAREVILLSSLVLGYILLLAAYPLAIRVAIPREFVIGIVRPYLLAIKPSPDVLAYSLVVPAVRLFTLLVYWRWLNGRSVSSLI